jgi:hypothetical protein
MMDKVQKHNSFNIEVLWVVISYGIVAGYQHFRGPSFIHLHNIIQHDNPEDINFKDSMKDLQRSDTALPLSLLKNCIC